MIFPFGETATIQSRVAGAPDRYGEPTWTWTSTTVEGCGFDPGISTETPQTFRMAVSTQPTLYAPPGTTVAVSDRVVVRGDTYDVDGHPWDGKSPFTGWEPGVVVKLTRSEG